MRFATLSLCTVQCCLISSFLQNKFFQNWSQCFQTQLLLYQLSLCNILSLLLSFQQSRHFHQGIFYLKKSLSFLKNFIYFGCPGSSLRCLGSLLLLESFSSWCAGFVLWWLLLQSTGSRVWTR